MVYLILLGLTFFVQLLTASWYIMTEGMKGKTKALPMKAFCSFLFIADALLCAAIKDSFSTEYFFLIFGGGIACFIGDILLNLNHKAAFTTGLFFFLSAHALYTCAFSRSLTASFGVDFFNITDIVIWAALALCFVISTFIKKFKLDFKEFKIPVIAYSLVILLMAVKAFHLGISAQLSGIGNYQSLSFTLIIGSAFFLASDFILMLMYFGGKNSHRNAIINAYLYYFGQMILTCSILFIGG